MYGYFKASRALGPLQITMKKMMIDVFHFLILFGICISAFAFGMTVLYRNYDGHHRCDIEDPTNNRTQTPAFVRSAKLFNYDTNLLSVFTGVLILSMGTRMWGSLIHVTFMPIPFQPATSDLPSTTWPIPQSPSSCTRPHLGR